MIMVLFGRIKNDDRILLIINGSRNNEGKIESLVFDYYEQKANLRVKNTTKTTAEYIYELSKSIYKKAQKKEKSITDALYDLKDIESVNVVVQNDEISG